MAAFIAAQRDEHQIPHAVACRALQVSRSWFYKWRGGSLPPRAARRERLKAEVARLFELHGGKYGSPRITADLRDAGWRVSENTVAALMRELGLAARRTHRRKSTTRPGKGRWRAPDLVKRDKISQIRVSTLSGEPRKSYSYRRRASRYSGHLSLRRASDRDRCLLWRAIVSHCLKDTQLTAAGSRS